MSLSICLSNVTCEVYVSGLCSSQDDDLSRSENLQVYLRVRPMTVTESNNGESQVCFSLFLFVTLSAIIISSFVDSYITNNLQST